MIMCYMSDEIEMKLLIKEVLEDHETIAYDFFCQIKLTKLKQAIQLNRHELITRKGVVHFAT